MPAYKTIAVAGATGNLGPSIIEALLSANFTITILSQSGKKPANLPFTGKILKVDYNSPESLTAALKDQEVFISLVPDFPLQPKLIDAAIAAGVKLFIPSEFGSDTQHAKVRSLPVFQGKVDTFEYLREKEREIDWTVIVNGIFFDWALQVGFWANLKGGPTPIYDGGDAKHSTTLLKDVGEAVVAVLKKPEETRNKVLYIQSTAISQNEIVEIAKKRNSALKMEIQKTSTEDVLKRSLEKFGKGPGPEFMDGAMGLIAVSIFNEGYGNNWSQRNDNELLGIRELSKDEIEEVVARYV